VLVVLVLAQEQKVLAKVVLGQHGGITLEVLGQLAEIAHILLARGQSIILEINVLLELSKRSVMRHSAARVPSSEASERENHT